MDTGQLEGSDSWKGCWQVW